MNQSIVACGRKVEIGVPVIIWNEPEGFLCKNKRGRRACSFHPPKLNKGPTRKDDNDYLITDLKPAYEQLKIYEKLMRERNVSFKNERIDKSWLDALELQMANISILIAETRLKFISSLNKILENNLDKVWPKSSLEISGFAHSNR